MLATTKGQERHTTDIADVPNGGCRHVPTPGSAGAERLWLTGVSGSRRALSPFSVGRDPRTGRRRNFTAPTLGSDGHRVIPSFLPSFLPFFSPLVPSPGEAEGESGLCGIVVDIVVVVVVVVVIVVPVFSCV